MPQSTAIVVVACHRTGSGLVSSMLSKMGVDMGLPDPADAKSPDELWEDQKFVGVHRAMFDEDVGPYDARKWQYPRPRLTPALVGAWADRAYERSYTKLWGFKDPRFPFVMDMGMGIMIALDTNIKLVWLRRAQNPVALSLQKRDGGTFLDNLKVASRQYQQWEEMRIKYRDWPSLNLTYENILANPARTVMELEEFVGCELTEADAAAIENLVRRNQAAT